MHALGLLQERVQGSESAQLADRVAKIEQQLQEANQSLSTAKSKKQEMVATAKVRLTCCSQAIVRRCDSNALKGATGRVNPSVSTECHILCWQALKRTAGRIMTSIIRKVLN